MQSQGPNEDEPLKHIKASNDMLYYFFEYVVYFASKQPAWLMM